MSIAQYFQEFCAALAIPSNIRSSIGYRTNRFTKQLNIDFRNLNSDSSYRFYAGSYGRNTAIPSVSDIDLIYVLPYSVYERYNGYASGGQSALLQAVRQSVERTYPKSTSLADGQIVSITFTDGITFEIVPVFLNTDESYTYANSNNGGSWKLCWPKHEIDAFSKRNVVSNRNLVELGRMARAWRDCNNVPMSGMLIDTLAYQFIDTWAYKDKSFLYYDFLTRDFFKFLAGQSPTQNYWTAPGSASRVVRMGNFEYKARQAELRSLEAMSHLEKNEYWSAKQKYREIYGTLFPS